MLILSLLIAAVVLAIAAYKWGANSCDGLTLPSFESRGFFLQPGDLPPCHR